ncbi:hypothetical protein AB0M36_31545 [Actinoplanes sp. NPDC051346]|uniref:hypothetical protein n=1 Tax=Actinoplanes sp. NPDC051346 TaxID=3155048 RepID=UPI00341F91FF
MLAHFLSHVTLTPEDTPAPDVIAERALVALGETADAVAAALTAAGFAGFPITADRCPIGNYVRASDVRITGVSVGLDAVRVWTATTHGIPAPVALPDAVRTFLGRFDARRYPDLIASPDETDPAVPPDPGTAETPAPAVYPMPAPADDARFTLGLTLDVGKVLAAHGYPPIESGTDLAGLQQALFGFLYSPIPAAPVASPLLTLPADPGVSILVRRR